MLKRILALLTAAILFSSLIFSAAFIILETEHDCIGDDCPMCSCIALCGGILRQFSFPPENLKSAFNASFIAALIIVQVICCTVHSTLITLKVKLSD